MQVKPIKFPTVHVGDDLQQLIKDNLDHLSENSVVAITSKVISLAEGRVEPLTKDKDVLVAQEADRYLDRQANKYGVCISVKNNTLIASAGIDLSNADGHYVLWPENPQQSANRLRKFFKDQYQVENVGVVITDSHVLPLRWGTVGTTLAHSGFLALNDYIGTPDLFGRDMKISKSNVSEGLAATAVVTMGEGAESTPVAIIENPHFVEFQDHDPTDEELSELKIEPQDDIFYEMFKSVDWKP